MLRIVVDTREQTPWPLTGFDTVRRKLDAGDYSLEGWEGQVAVERKSKEDAWGCVGAGRRRFEACLARLAALDRAAVVIESGIGAFSIPPAYVKRVTAATAVGSYISWACRYRIPVFWCDDRRYAERVAVRFLAAYVKHVAARDAAIRVGGTT